MSAATPRSARRLKVLFITPWYPGPRDSVEGTFVREHVKAASLRDDVAVIHLAGSTLNHPNEVYQIDRFTDLGLPVNVPALRVTYRHPPIPKTAYLIYLWSAVSAYRQLVHSGFRPEIIHANIYSAGVPAVLIGTLYRGPVIVSEHSSAFPEGRLSRLELRKARVAFRRAKVVMPVSLFLQRAIERLGLEGSYRLVPNAVDTDIFYPGTRTSASGQKRLLFVGQLKPVKGFPLLLDALSRVSRRFDWRLDVIGDDPGRGEYESMTTEFRIAERVRFHGTKSKGEVADFMRDSDALVLASRTENQPCVILEAMATGLPVVATAVGGIPEMLDPSSGLLVAPGDPIDLARGITSLLEGDAGLRPIDTVKSARARFSLDAVGALLATIYREFTN